MTTTIRQRLREQCGPVCVFCGSRGVHLCPGGYLANGDLERRMDAGLFTVSESRNGGGWIDANAFGIAWWLLDRRMTMGEWHADFFWTQKRLAKALGSWLAPERADETFGR